MQPHISPYNSDVCFGKRDCIYQFESEDMDHGQQDTVRKPSGRVDPANRHGQLRKRSGVRTCAEAGSGAICGHRLLRTDLLRDCRTSNWRAFSNCAMRSRSSDTEFVARVAIYSRTQSFMKDMPALLCAWLSARDARLHEAVFARVIDNARMLRTYVQILRSGVVGRKSLGTAPKRLVREWLASRDEEALFSSSAGQSPSLSDIVKMVHPKPAGPKREAFYGYMIGRSYDANALPKLVMQFEQFKAGEARMSRIFRSCCCRLCRFPKRIGWRSRRMLRGRPRA